MNILFRADSSSTIGTGHIMRDLVLAKQFKNAHIIFATQALEGNINHKIIEEGYRVETLKSNSLDEFNNLITKYNSTMIIIDHYGINYQFEKTLKERNSLLKIMVLDDTYEKHHCDILLNHNISAEMKKYNGLVPEECVVKCGTEYTLLREEFIEEKLIQREKIYDYLLAFGGADTENLNIHVLEVLLEMNHNNKIVVITTTANRNLKYLKEFSQNRESITLKINSTQVAQLMNQSKFAIITPSVTANEIYFLEVPFIAIETANNQKDMSQFLLKNGYSVLKSLNKSQLKASLSEIKLINFIDLSLDEKEMVLEWRNHPSIRKWMFSQYKISIEDHLQYIDILSSKKNRIYFLVKKETKAIGVIDLTDIDFIASNAHIGLYAQPNLRGVGKILMEEIINYAFNKLKLNKLVSEVFQKNKPAINLYEKFGFQEIHRKENIIVMELKNENR